MKELFNYIKPEQQHSPSQVLILKIGEDLRSALVTDPSWADLYYVAYANAGTTPEYDLDEFEKKHPWITGSFNSVKLILDYPRNLIIPEGMLTKDQSRGMLDDMHSFCGDEIIAEEKIPGWELKNIYTLPKEIDNWIRKKFSVIDYRHADTLALSNLPRIAEGSVLVDFRTTEFTVMAQRDRQFLAARRFVYETPQDVLYYLLRLFDHFGLSQSATQLLISGLIDKDSGLYKELYQYFAGIDIRHAGWKDAGGYPAHFFTSFNDLSRCEL